MVQKKKKINYSIKKQLFLVLLSIKNLSADFPRKNNKSSCKLYYEIDPKRFQVQNHYFILDTAINATSN